MYPSLNQFRFLAKRFRVIPVWAEPALPTDEVMAWAHTAGADSDPFFLLHSPSPGAQSRYSYFALNRPRYRLEARQGELSLHYQSDSGARYDAIKVGNPFDRFADWMNQWTAPQMDALPPFWGGAVGYWGYESARYLEPRLDVLFQKRRTRASTLPLEDFPDFEFGLFDQVAAVDHARKRLWLVHAVMLPERRELSPHQLEKLYRAAQDRLRRHAVTLQKNLHRHAPWRTFRFGELRDTRSKAAYEILVRRAKGHITAGDSYQTNLSHALWSTWEGDPWTLYHDLTRINPSPYAAFWRSQDRWVVSGSPELLVRKEGNRVETRPIAGTSPRQPGDDLDPTALNRLLKDVKEKAEHIMLVDLERNDLGRICKPGSIRLSEALSVETYSHVHHIVSDVQGELAEGRTWQDVVRACFPGGTITGCPKLRSMEIIQKLESTPRGPYCGSMGWIGFQGDMALNIMIRSYFLNRDTLAFPVGAGIVSDSVPSREFQETMHKAHALILALQGFKPHRAVNRPVPPSA